MEAMAEKLDDVEAQAEIDDAAVAVDETIAEREQEIAAETPAAIPPEPPADCPSHIREHYDQIREKEREVYDLESKYLGLKEHAAVAKKDFENADKALRNLISRGADRQKSLPFEKAAAGRKPKRIKLLVDLPGTTMKVGFEPPITVDDCGDVSAVFSDGTSDQEIELELDQYEVIEWENGDENEAPTNDAWRRAPFADLGLTAKQNDLFESIGVRTIGELEDLRARIAENKPDAQWPKGIGPAKVTDIENRVIDWLDKNRDKFGEPVDAGGRTLWGTELPPVPVAEAATDVESVIPEPEETVPIHKAVKGNGKAKHKANGKAKAKKKKGRR